MQTRISSQNDFCFCNVRQIILWKFMKCHSFIHSNSGSIRSRLTRSVKNRITRTQQKHTTICLRCDVWCVRLSILHTETWIVEMKEEKNIWKKYPAIRMNGANRSVTHDSSCRSRFPVRSDLWCEGWLLMLNTVWMCRPPAPLIMTFSLCETQTIAFPFSTTY